MDEQLLGIEPSVASDSVASTEPAMTSGAAAAAVAIPTGPVTTVAVDDEDEFAALAAAMSS